jgi:hypothetical protein
MSVMARTPFHLSERLTQLDPSQAPFRRAAKQLYANVIQGFMEHVKEQFPNDEERKEFGRQAYEDMQNSLYHLYATMYDRRFLFWI